MIDMIAGAVRDFYERDYGTFIVLLATYSSNMSAAYSGSIDLNRACLKKSLCYQ